MPGINHNSATPSGLPIGVQFVGRFGEEHLLLQLAADRECRVLEHEVPASIRTTDDPI